MFFHKSLAEGWLCFVFLIKKEKPVVKEKSGLHKGELLKYHESFLILVFFYFPYDFVAILKATALQTN